MLNIKEIGLCGGVWLAGACVFSFVAKGAEWIVKEKDESLGRTRRKQLFRRAAVSGGGGVTALLCMEKKETLPASVTLFLFFAVLAGAALVDQDTLEIPDGFHGAIGLLGFVSIFTMPGVPVWERLAGSLCVSLPLFLLTAVIPGAFGGGDIKLTAACGFSWVGKAVPGAEYLQFFLRAPGALFYWPQSGPGGKIILLSDLFLLQGWQQRFSGDGGSG